MVPSERQQQKVAILQKRACGASSNGSPGFFEQPRKESFARPCCLRNKKNPTPKTIVSGTRLVCSWYHPDSQICRHIRLFKYDCKMNSLYSSSVTGAPVALSFPAGFPVPSFQCAALSLSSAGYSLLLRSCRSSLQSNKSAYSSRRCLFILVL